MAGDPPDDEAPGVQRDRPAPGMPRWVKVGIAVLVVVLVAVVLSVLTGVHQPPAGGHGP